MMELIVGGVAGLFGVILLRFLATTYETKRQEKMEQEVAEIKKRQEVLNSKIKEQDRITQEKINEIDTQKNIELVGDALADFFNNHKGKH
jgi:Mg2+/citrate symporter